MTTGLKSEKQYIGEKRFTPEDQQLFASVSSDYNPMHMDAVAARRLITGRQVVHGVHILLTAIEYWQNDRNLRPSSLSCSFNNPVSLDDTVRFTQQDRESNIVIEASVNGLLCTQVVIGTGQSGSSGKAEPDATPFALDKVNSSPDKLKRPLDETPEFHLDKKYAIRLNAADFSAKFPKVHLYFGKEGFAAISSLSYFVGMVCPGLHSIFSSLSFKLTSNPVNDDHLIFVVQKYNNRYHLFDISFRGIIQGSIKAFLRPHPYRQPSVADLSSHVLPLEFRGTKSLIIGGSRGLGELTAKILAAGGGDVIITYASGHDDAKAISDEINGSGLGTCKTVKVDLTTDSFNSLNIDSDAPDAVYFFATPRIGRSKAEFFDQKLFREFYDFYVNRFYELCVYLEACATEKKIKVYFPSTVYVSERPEGLTEYAMAKAAAEVLISEINKSFRKVSVMATRLPRLNTDQTSSIVKLATESNVETLLPVIRSLNKL